MSGLQTVQIRRVGFRDGTDAELTMLHAVEASIEVERGSTRMPQPLEAYIAYARNLPLQFDVHAWLAETRGGESVGAGYCWSNSAGDGRVMECDVLVNGSRRREGIGTQLMGLICEQTIKEGRSLLTWSTFDRVPAAESFARAVAGRVARVNRTSELVLAEVDWTMVEQWATDVRCREVGYSLEIIDGPMPNRLRGDAAKFHHIMQSAPRDDLDIGEVLIDTDFVAELDRALLQRGRRRCTVFVRDPDGSCVGGTEVTFEPSDPRVAYQQNTGIDPAHRGRGLAKWAKATMLELIRDQHPEVHRVRTGNAFSNAPMLQINDTLGFKVVSTYTDWQADVDNVRRALG